MSSWVEKILEVVLPPSDDIESGNTIQKLKLYWCCHCSHDFWRIKQTCFFPVFLKKVENYCIEIRAINLFSYMLFFPTVISYQHNKGYSLKWQWIFLINFYSPIYSHCCDWECIKGPLPNVWNYYSYMFYMFIYLFSMGGGGVNILFFEAQIFRYCVY